MSSYVLQIGAQVQSGMAAMREISRFAYTAVAALWVTRRENIGVSLSVVVNQIYFTGIQAMPILTGIAFLLGSLVCFQALPYLIDVGATEFIGVIFVLSIIRELGPLFTAIVVICRSGAAIAAELSTNKVNLELEALEAMGINLHHFIVIPRVLGMMISMFALTIYFNALAIAGGYWVGSNQLGLTFMPFVRYLLSALDVADIYVSFIKSFLFGFVVAILCSYYGIHAGRASTFVPQVVAKGVIRSVLIVIALNFVISAAIYYL